MTLGTTFARFQIIRVIPTMFPAYILYFILCVLLLHSHFALLIFNCSNFSDVFDEDHFINSLADDVKIIKMLPKELAATIRAVKHFRSWSGVEYYEEEIGSIFEEYQVCVKKYCCLYCLTFLSQLNEFTKCSGYSSS